MLHQDSHRIGPHANKRRMTKTDHAAKTQNQVQAAGRQRKDQNAAGHADVEVLVKCQRQHWQQQQANQQTHAGQRRQRVVKEARQEPRNRHRRGLGSGCRDLRQFATHAPETNLAA